MNPEQVKKKYYPEINIARGLGVLLVLMGHSFPDAEIGVFAHPWYQWGYDVCYSFHMALFFVISGFVMGRRFYSPEYKLTYEIVKKIKRLMIPYLFLAYLSLLPKIVLNAYARNPVDTNSAIRVLLGQSPNGSLWYLYTLFLLSVLVLCLGRAISCFGEAFKNICLLFLGTGGYVLYVFAGAFGQNPFFFDKICRYLIFYVLGILLYRYYDRAKRMKYVSLAVISLGLVMLFTNPYVHVKVDYMITALLGTYGILVIAGRIMEHKESKGYRFLNGCGTRSYDIYIISYYVQQTIRVICFRIWGWDYPVVFVMELLLGFSLSYLFSVYVLRRSRLLKRILIGVWED